MSERVGNEAGDELTQWLKEAGRRTASGRPAPGEDDDRTYNSPASLHRYLEELAGRKLQSHTEVLGYLREVAETRPRAYREGERRRMLRETILLAVLAISYLHYYYWDVQLEIASLKSVGVLIHAPTAAAPRTSL